MSPHEGTPGLRSPDVRGSRGSQGARRSDHRQKSRPTSQGVRRDGQHYVVGTYVPIWRRYASHEGQDTPNSDYRILVLPGVAPGPGAIGRCARATLAAAAHWGRPRSCALRIRGAAARPSCNPRGWGPRPHCVSQGRGAREAGSPVVRLHSDGLARRSWPRAAPPATPRRAQLRRPGGARVRPERSVSTDVRAARTPLAVAVLSSLFRRPSLSRGCHGCCRAGGRTRCCRPVHRRAGVSSVGPTRGNGSNRKCR